MNDNNEVVTGLENALFLRLVRGERLPSKERLARMYEVTDETVNAAVDSLVGRGLVASGSDLRIDAGALLETGDLDGLVKLMRAATGEERALELEAQLLDLLSINCQEVVFRAVSCRTDEHVMWFEHYLRMLTDRIELDAHVGQVAAAQFQLLRVLSAAAGSVAFTVMLNAFRNYVQGPSGLELFPPEAWAQLADAMKKKDVSRARGIVQRCFDRRVHRVLQLLSRSGGGRRASDQASGVEIVVHLPNAAEVTES